MEITWIGAIIIGITFFLLLHYKLTTPLKLAIFFLPLGTIAVINVYLEPGFGIGLDQYFAALLILSLFSFVVLRKYRGPNLPGVIKWLFFLLLLLIIVSWIVPFYNEDIKIRTVLSSQEFFDAPLSFSIYNITKFFYLLFSIFFFVVAYKSLNLLRPSQIARIFIASCSLIAFTALLDFIPNISVLRGALINNISYGVTAAKTSLYIGQFGIPRLSGLMIEPSHLVQIMLFGLSIMVVFYIKGITIFSRKIDLILLSLFFTVSILTYSPVFLGGFLVIAIYTFIKSISSRYRSKKLFKIATYSLVGTGMIVLVLQHLWGINILYATVVTLLGRFGMAGELAGFQSTYRLQSIQTALEAFKQSPFIGVGWGSLSLQVGLPLLLLGSIGIIGFIIFLCLLVSLLVIAIKKIKRSDSVQEQALREGFLLAFLIMIGIFSITKGSMVFQYLLFWFIAAGLVANYKPNESNHV